MKKLYLAALVIVTIAIILFAVQGLALDLPKWFPFSTHRALREWKEKVFKGKVLYEVKIVRAKEGGYLLARSDRAASGLFYDIKFNLYSAPMVSWRWKVLKFPDKQKENYSKSEWVERDDYAARFYIIFPKFPFTRTECLEYVWDETLPVGTVVASPYFEKIKLIVIESGKEKLGKWVYEERNVYQDYLTAFGKPPENRVGAIAIMTDSDNTVSTAEACYDEIKIGYRKNGGKK
ncbi:MAG: DUF3047 domain-containing protein [Candidatus Omnitrophota bacterium]|nr:DUF3047 domain-containing protein [Candidatus Omnitrophota bacterium]